MIEGMMMTTHFFISGFEEFQEFEEF